MRPAGGISKRREGGNRALKIGFCYGKRPPQIKRGSCNKPRLFLGRMSGAGRTGRSSCPAGSAALSHFSSIRVLDMSLPASG